MKVKPATKAGRVLVEMYPQDENILAEASTETTPFKIKNILVPIDFSPLSKKALQYAAPFAQKHEARITLVHVVEPVLYPENYLGAIPPDAELVNINRAKEARKELATLRQSEIGSTMPAELFVHIGYPAEEIINIAGDEDADLIVIATHGHTGMKHVFLGSTTERVVRHAPCPVLVVREKERDFV
jgi:nucleotide-binding universal stress UspA family protein